MAPARVAGARASFLRTRTWRRRYGSTNANIGIASAGTTLESVQADARLSAFCACQRSQSVCRPIQNSGDILNSFPSRIALSAVMARRPRMISLSLFSGCPSAGQRPTA